MKKQQVVQEPLIAYELKESFDSNRLVTLVREGVQFSVFSKLLKRISFSLQEWSSFLHLSQLILST